MPKTDNPQTTAIRLDGPISLLPHWHRRIDTASILECFDPNGHFITVHVPDGRYEEKGDELLAHPHDR